MPAHRQTPWRQDPAILERMEKAFSLYLMGQSARGIARTLNVDPKTITTDIRHAFELRLELTAESFEDKVQRRLYELDEVIRQSYLAFMNLQGSSLNRSAHMANILRALAEKSKIEGLYAPVKTEVTGRDGAPIEVELADLQKQIEGELERVGLRLDGHTPGDPGVAESDAAETSPELSHEPLPLPVLRPELDPHPEPEPQPGPREHVRMSVWPNQDNAPEPGERTASSEPRPRVQTPEQVRKGVYETHDDQRRYGSAGW